MNRLTAPFATLIAALCLGLAVTGAQAEVGVGGGKEATPATQQSEAVPGTVKKHGAKKSVRHGKKKAAKHGKKKSAKHGKAHGKTKKSGHGKAKKAVINPA